MKAPIIKIGRGESALLQARHVLNEAERNAASNRLETDESGNVIARIHPYAWGLFKSTILTALKGREDLRSRNPELFSEDTPCPYCEGSGYYPIPEESPQYKDALEMGHVSAGQPIWECCSPCQSTGVFTLLDRKWEEDNPYKVSERGLAAEKAKKGEWGDGYRNSNK